MRFLEDPPRFLFFTGKGGVGKTSVACATALDLVGRGKRVLLVSTDPASNVGQVFGVRIGNTVTPLVNVPGLSALEIDPEEAAAAYRERIVAPVRGLLPEDELAGIIEGLSGSCTTEIASFDEFTSLLADESVSGQYDHVVFDTAPTGHTIRLLQLPGSWTEFLEAGKGDPSCLGPLSGLDKHRSMYAAAVGVLTDPARTRLVLVARAQTSSLAEIERTYRELNQIGIDGGFVVVNGVLPEAAGEEDLTRAVRARERAALADLPAAISGLPLDVLELRAANMVGIPALKSLFAASTDTGEPGAIGAIGAIGETTEPGDVVDAPLAALVDAIERDDHGLVLCMGKGGVGKTTIAAAIAVALAERGHAVHLTTTDPAAHLTETLHGSVPGLEVSRIDPVEAVQTYRDHVMATKGKALDAEGRAALAEDLLSPCTEEVAVFQQFSRVVHESRRRFVVVDTAPTGHTLLLLDATGSYHREMARQIGDSLPFTTPLMRLQDPALTKVVLVTLAETTPVLEAEGLREDLERAGIRPWAWVVNASLAAAHPTSPFLRARAAHEVEQIDRVRRIADRIAIVPLLPEEPIGQDRLAALTELEAPSLQPAV
ncbi:MULTISPECIES: arsenical pump-driving ATPase [unclassified Cryobacterium]|uniref:arsenical pump-driving ATPase n=1 Tax=unclassified Cryobacterium TaxID=2649013 RepID=UPI002AB46745|nr:MULTISPECIES: arsenical pump-driving ATPase [unclassified Cryobacterium]MDY7543004.1 arsenical pump-driving ATPase [Cryobacterium sp. 5B3]MEA9999301.1 arsenical pump-driving ATPase [Cryobacterium sp. RTS3]MEB0266105.1 arsenical pump-driving ATPase [Cryobacterium sp. 10I5]MEB0274053.1 arsenical pump-driving ATPase [Cryobacterium sp. 5B3]